VQRTEIFVEKSDEVKEKVQRTEIFVEKSGEVLGKGAAHRNFYP
jgi:hypothetical protein